MIIFKDVLTGDELLSDSFEQLPIGDPVLDQLMFKVKGKWVVQGPVDVDIGANASAEGGDDEGVDDTAVKVVDVIDTFRLQEQPTYDKAGFVGYVKAWVPKVAAKLPEEEAKIFKDNATAATKFLLSKRKDLQFFLGENNDIDGTLVYALYEAGEGEPTFYYFKHALVEEKV